MLCKHFGASGAIALLLVTIAGSILFVGCKAQKVETYWSATPVQVDGQMTDWAGYRTIYFEDSGVQLGLRNDSQNLYVLFRFSNQTWGQAIGRGGLTLWLDNSGKKKKGFGIRYAGGPSNSEMQKGEMPNRGGFSDSLTPEQQQRFANMRMAATHQLIVINKKSDEERAISADGSAGPAVSFGSPEGVYTYEFSIPLQNSDVSHYGIGAQPGQAICLGLEWGGAGSGGRQSATPKMGGGQEGGGGEGTGGGPPGGMGGGPPGGMGGGPPGGMGGGRGGSGTQPPEKQEIWVRTSLASPPAR
ncbi:MAG: hypothetical protein WCE90_13175 [Candidatus Zixiibacteriota bacterium]